MHEVKFGTFILPGDIPAAQASAKRAESDGFFSISVNDHFYSPLGNPQSPQLECFTALTAMACVTSKIKLAPAVAANSFRSPPLLAKIISSVDSASNGRLIVGLGAGWQDKEYYNHGYPFPSTAERLEQLDEAIQILKAMWTQDSPSYRGKYFYIHEAYNNPRPVQQPHPPIMLGGSGTKLLKIAAREATILNIIPPTGNGKDFVNDPVAAVKFDTTVLKQRIGLLHKYMEEAGRDPQEMELGGLLLLGLSKQADDPWLRELSKNLGFSDYAMAQRAPVCVLGTPDEAKCEIAKRVKDTGVTYFMFVVASEETQDLFVKEVMPEFVKV
ncbi:MAG: LLM class flavin-dependent oxidoreductase [Gammaproteobacteria bacterium]|nr:LLM class flavin-dependent oxidoreductase [Gammaproteobacteria bacterium]